MLSPEYGFILKKMWAKNRIFYFAEKFSTARESSRTSTAELEAQLTIQVCFICEKVQVLTSDFVHTPCQKNFILFNIFLETNKRQFF